MLWLTAVNNSCCCRFIAFGQSQGLWRFASSTAHCTCRRLSNPWWGKHNHVFCVFPCPLQHSSANKTACIRLCARVTWTLRNIGIGREPRWAKENPEIFRQLWLCGTLKYLPKPWGCPAVQNPPPPQWWFLAAWTCHRSEDVAMYL